MKAPSARRGFGLIELLIAGSLTVIVLGLLTQAARTTTGLASTSLTLGGIEQRGSAALHTVAHELRWARPGTLLVTQENGCSRLDFEVVVGESGGAPVWSSTITVRYEPSAVDSDGDGAANEGRLVRAQDGRTRSLCREVRLGSFTATLQGETVELALEVFGVPSARSVLSREVRQSVSLMNRLED